MLRQRLKKLIAIALTTATFAGIYSTLAAPTKHSKDDIELAKLRKEEWHNQFTECLLTTNEDHESTTISKRKRIIEIRKEYQEQLADPDYLYYQSQDGCDLINACLRGDLSVAWRYLPGFRYEGPRVPKEPASWGSSLHVDPRAALHCIKKSLALKKELSQSELPEMIVYRGICLPKVLNSVENNNTANRCVIEDILLKVTSGTSQTEVFPHKNIIYQAKDISSTSKEKETARYYADRIQQKYNVTPIILEITITKGTGFGMDLHALSEGQDSKKEVLLKPGQKIKINSAHKEGHYILLKCQTVL